MKYISCESNWLNLLGNFTERWPRCTIRRLARVPSSRPWRPSESYLTRCSPCGENKRCYYSVFIGSESSKYRKSDSNFKQFHSGPWNVISKNLTWDSGHRDSPPPPPGLPWPSPPPSAKSGSPQTVDATSPPDPRIGWFRMNRETVLLMFLPSFICLG